MLDKFDAPEKVTEWLTDKRKRRALLEPMANYSEFVNSYIGVDVIFEPAFGYERLIEIRNKKVGIIGLNSAWLSGRNKEVRKGESVANDYGHLILGEAQVYDLIKSPSFNKSDLRIVVLHHPFDWLADFDKQVVRDQIRKSSQFILHGHEHQPEIRTERGTGGNCITIPAGASYDRREPTVARYANAYNYVHLNIETGKGKVYLRRYEDRQGWIKDSGTTGDSKPGLWSFTLSKETKKQGRRSQPKIEKKLLTERLERILRLYLATSYEREQYAKLDQAGEADPDRTTLLQQIFVDLEVSQYGETHPKDINRPLATIEKRDKSSLELREVDGKKIFSVIQCLLQEVYPMNVIIGGPGQGKSTLTQFISQIQRSAFLKGETNKAGLESSVIEIDEPRFSPKNCRAPFRIILKYFAQWLSENPKNETVESYLAEEMEKDASETVTSGDIHEILRSVPSLIIFDGLDEVIEPDLRERLLSRISEFFRRKEQLRANTQIVATSRPTGYTGQFNPEFFWHLELQPMSEKKVREYGTKWVNIKIQSDEERKRVLDTLKECQQEEHTKLLLYTPLQVTIVLLITKDGGRPPAQREALFHEYWNTIYRREKAKAKGVIRTEESLLFELHSYLGYLLHFRAAAKNVRSLLPATDFYQAVYTYLHSKDSHSPKEEIERRAAQMVKEAGERLVLLVEPEPGFFGFELRSLQEFFAAAFLAQTARDTHQRFARLKAISPYAHWRNVALFFSGRIVRNFSGEAANILELVCRSIDREPSFHYHKWGAWLAFDIATDGAFAANRDLQYGALEYALTVLDGPIERDKQIYLKTALQRLSPEDRRDILKPIMEHKIVANNLSCLLIALDVYGMFIGPSSLFLQGIDKLLSSNKIEYVRQALILCLTHKVETQWLGERLENYWLLWSADEQVYEFILNTYIESQDYFYEVFSTWSPSQGQAFTLIKYLSKSTGYRPVQLKISNFVEKLSSLADQIILTIQCQVIRQYAARNVLSPFEIINHDVYLPRPIGGHRLEVLLQKQLRISEMSLKKLLKKNDLEQDLRALLWIIYLMIFYFPADMITAFVRDSRLLLSNKTNSIADFKFLYPLLAGIIQEHHKNQEILKRQLKKYSVKEEIKHFELLRDRVQELATTLSKEELANVLFKIQIGDNETLAQFKTNLSDFGIDSSKFLFKNIFFFGESKAPIAADRLYDAFLAMERNIDDLEFVSKIQWDIVSQTWLTDNKTRLLGIKLLRTFTEKFARKPELIGDLISFSLKMLASDPRTLGEFPQFLKFLGSLRIKYQQDEMVSYSINRTAVTAPSKCLKSLAGFLKDDDKDLCQGAAIFLASVIKSVSRFDLYAVRKSRERFFSNTSLDIDTAWPLVNSTNLEERNLGITLLVLAKFPFDESTYCSSLLEFLQNADTEAEIENWAEFIQYNYALQKARSWRETLEFILSQPHLFAQKILETSLERYIELTGEKPFQINADFLGLPKTDH